MSFAGGPAGHDMHMQTEAPCMDLGPGPLGGWGGVGSLLSGATTAHSPSPEYFAPVLNIPV